MYLLIFGIGGMLGNTLLPILSQRHKVFTISHDEIDINETVRLFEYLKNENINCVVNCAAITDTTYCGTNDGMIKSFSVNCLGVKNLSEICHKLGIHLIHISTDYVHSEYQSEEDEEFPINVYGCHKLLGEKYIEQTFKDKTQYSILRCSWMYGMTNRKKNFVDKVIDFCNNSKDGTIKIVDDCFGRPSSTEYVSEFIKQCIESKQYGIIDSQIYNKPISRYEFAKMIVEEMNLNIEVIPVKSDYFKNTINQNKTVPLKFRDDSNNLQDIIKNIPHNNDYRYWLKRYLNEKYGK